MKNKFEFYEDVSGFFINILVCFFIILFSLGIGSPWAICRMARWHARNTSLNGVNTQFIGKGEDLVKDFFIWFLFTILTFGIYGIWMSVKVQKFIVENTILPDSEEEIETGQKLQKEREEQEKRYAKTFLFYLSPYLFWRWRPKKYIDKTYSEYNRSTLKKIGVIIMLLILLFFLLF